MNANPYSPGRSGLVYLVLTMAMLLWSGLRPHDRQTWLMEVAPVLIGLPLLVWSARRFPLTPLLYALLFVHGLILMIGGKYTYAEVPLGFWVQDAFDLSRNHYDRLGHLAQGFIPAILARELLRRFTPLAGGWLAFLAGACVLAFSAFYELIEWWAAVFLGSSAEAFLGTQGDPWDTQWDMFLALCGASISLAVLSAWHEKQLVKSGLVDREPRRVIE